MELRTRIYIPTRGRVGQHKQHTLSEFLSYSSHRPILVCPPDEFEHHRKYYPSVSACSAKGIGPTRQWILERARADVVVMADDDMRFAYRPDPKVSKLERCTDLDGMVQAIEQAVEAGYLHGGVGARQGNNHKVPDGKGTITIENGHLCSHCDRVNNLHFMLRGAVLELGVRFDGLPVMEDFYFTLSLLTRGHANRVIHNYVWNQAGSGAEGGCSLYRTEQVQALGAYGLQKAFPQFVKVVTKNSKSVWKGFKERKDVIIQWQKAYKSSQAQQKTPAG